VLIELKKNGSFSSPSLSDQDQHIVLGTMTCIITDEFEKIFPAIKYLAVTTKRHTWRVGIYYWFEVANRWKKMYQVGEIQYMPTAVTIVVCD
jgi:hypothetical protein